MICRHCHSNSINTGSRLPNISDVKTRKRRNMVGIDMIRNNCIQTVHEQNMYWKLSLFVIFKTLYSYHGKFIDIVSPMSKN